ncbi:MAG: MBL fold metallo-hydrolase, partial [Methylobacterium sp.]|nr:MBL fold metallo-hydrolase [Methylobacterium sp.]
HTLLYDAGPRYSDEADSGNRIILPYLRGAGIAGLDGMIISHDDNDHAGGAKSVIEAMPPGWLISSLAPGHALRAAVPDSHACGTGQSWNWDGVRFTILHPDTGAAASADRSDNDRSCVLKIATGHGSVLLPGDIERRSELELLERNGGRLRADLLLAPHHGSRSSSTGGFVDAVQPDIVVFTAGYRNRFRHPHPEVVARYRDQGSRMLRSDRDGAILFTFASGTVKVLPWREQRPRYWHARVAENARSG